MRNWSSPMRTAVPMSVPPADPIRFTRSMIWSRSASG